MITKKEISELHNFNLPMLKEALRQTELRVNYTIDTKKRLDAKALSLLTVYLSFASLFCMIININSNFISVSLLIKSIFYISALSLSLGVYQLYKSLKSTDNATVGRYPSTWLYDKARISGEYKENQMSDNEGFIITHILNDYETSIEVADNSNDNRVILINKAIKFGILAISSLLIYPILESIFYLLSHF
jgi:hypothetical protein